MKCNWLEHRGNFQELDWIASLVPGKPELALFYVVLFLPYVSFECLAAILPSNPARAPLRWPEFLAMGYIFRSSRNLSGMFSTNSWHDFFETFNSLAVCFSMYKLTLPSCVGRLGYSQAMSFSSLFSHDDSLSSRSHELSPKWLITKI